MYGKSYALVIKGIFIALRGHACQGEKRIQKSLCISLNKAKKDQPWQIICSEII